MHASISELNSILETKLRWGTVIRATKVLGLYIKVFSFKLIVIFLKTEKTANVFVIFSGFLCMERMVFE